MANTSSAKKAIRVAQRNAEINLHRRRSMKEARKEVQKAVAIKEKATAESLMPKAYKEIDKAAKLGVIHKNTASRYKSRLSALVKTLA